MQTTCNQTKENDVVWSRLDDRRGTPHPFAGYHSDNLRLFLFETSFIIIFLLC